jgi:hypothetical protein
LKARDRVDWTTVVLVMMIIHSPMFHSWERQPFKERKGSLPCSQKTATRFYPEPDETNPRLKTYFTRIHFNIIVPSTLRSSKYLFRLSNQNFIQISHIPHACYMAGPYHRLDSPNIS